MASSIASLIVTMIADTGAFNSDMKRTAAQQAKLMKQIEREAAVAGKAIGVAFAAVATAATVMVAKSINAADRMRDLSITTGISTEALSKLEFVASQSGVSLDALTGGITKMQKSLIAARDNTSQTADMFSRLGLSVSDLLKLTPEQQFAEVAGAISKLGTAAERTAAATAIFSRSGAALLPVLLEGKEGVAAMSAEVERAGAVISTDFANNADVFNDNLGSMKLIMTGVANEFTGALLPSLISMQEEFIESGKAAEIARDAGELLGGMAEGLAKALKLLADNATLVEIAFGGYLGLKILAPLLFALGPAAAAAAVAIGLVTAAVVILSGETDKTSKILKQIEGDIKGVTQAWIENATATQLLAKQEQLRSGWLKADELLIDAENRLATAQQALGFGTSITATDIAGLQAEVDRLRKAQQEALDPVVKMNVQLEKLGKEAGAAVPPLTGLGSGLKTAATAMKEWTSRSAAAQKSMEENIKAVEEIEAAHAEYNETLQEFVDIGDPIGALMREFGVQVEFANAALAKGDLTLEQYWDTLNTLSDQLGETVAGMQDVVVESDAMKEAMLEGVRILERAFQDMWTSIFDGGKSMFKGLVQGFKSLLAQMTHDITTGPLLNELKKLFDPKGGAINFDAITSSLAGLAGIGIGTLIGGGGQSASAGAAIGSIIGLAAGGVIGTVIGGILGGLLGGLLGGGKKTPQLQVSGFNNRTGKGTNISFDTEFGKAFIHARHLDAQAIAEVKKSIVEFDSAIASFLDDNQIGAITEALAKWNVSMAGEAISTEELLGSRFAAILSTFSDTLQDFVNDAVSLEEKVARLQVGVGAEKLFQDQPDLFGQHSVKEFLAVVNAFRDGTETITEAFNEVLQLLAVVQTVKESLIDFGSSDLGSDFANLLRLQSESVVETLSRMTSGLDDAMRNFDGSPEQLVQIGNLAMSVRQQELTALTLIDSIQKGLNANLERLLEDTKATISGPRAAEDILFDARALIGTVSQASTPEEIAKIGQEFEALIRSLSPEDTKAFGTSTLAIIEAFKAASNTALEQAKQAIIESGDAIRDLVDGFAAMIDPLNIIALSNERAAAALEAIAQTNSTDNSADITAALTDGVADMSIKLANAIRTGFAGANVTVNVVVQDQSLVTQ